MQRDLFTSVLAVVPPSRRIDTLAGWDLRRRDFAFDDDAMHHGAAMDAPQYVARGSHWAHEREGEVFICSHVSRTWGQA